MAVGTSSVSIRDIYNEINGTNYGAGAQIGSGVSMSSLRTSSNAYTSGTYTGGTPDVEAAPDRISEWFSYTHAISMGNITYAVRLSDASGIATWSLKTDVSATSTDDSAVAEGAITIWRTHDNSNTYIKAKAYTGGSNSVTSFKQYHSGSSGSNLTTTTSGVTIATIPVSNVTISASVQTVVGTSTSYTPTVPSPGGGSGVPDDITGTGAALLFCRGAEPVEVDANSADIESTKMLLTLTASKAGYQTTILNGGNSGHGFVIHSSNDAEADGGE
tara:strand:- start:684 stop:1505 length:822 start_codon:yes stop_codon:yes gene_type:complete